MGNITFTNYTVTTCNFFVITMHCVNIVLTPIVFYATEFGEQDMA